MTDQPAPDPTLPDESWSNIRVPMQDVTGKLFLLTEIVSGKIISDGRPEGVPISVSYTGQGIHIWIDEGRYKIPLTELVSAVHQMHLLRRAALKGELSELHAQLREVDLGDAGL